MTITAPDGRMLTDGFVRLDRLTTDDIPELYDAIARPEVYGAGFGGIAGPPRDLDHMRDQWTKYADTHLIYAIRLVADNRLVGTSSFAEIDVRNESIEVGATAFRPSLWGSGLNPATKLLMLSHVFDECGFGRVAIGVDARNTRSLAAVARLGASREGVLRRFQRCYDGRFRDLVLFSILADEWPKVREGLQVRLGR
ncbi:GNAT family N-acetyltransferase [Kribbella deserti]|uniref:GNAT family N-acetyltransferase n=1 Tax=Kribbella deserti TaxID=1926257 RepID=A0ABV6QUQ9_9ACTN